MIGKTERGGIHTAIAGMLALVLTMAGCLASVRGGELAELPVGELKTILTLAEACRRAYDESDPAIVETRSGCAALVLRDGHGNIVLAYRGSLLGVGEGGGPFAALGGKVVKRHYRDWAATNLKQATGFLPRQYEDAAHLAAEYAATLPEGATLYLTGHSKGGGAAEYAAVAAHLDPLLPSDRVRCVTFNAAIVRESNWRRLFGRRTHRDRETIRRELAEPGKLTAITMLDDPVSRIGAEERSLFGVHMVITPQGELTPMQQHGIAAVIDEITRILERADPENPRGGRRGDS